MFHSFASTPAEKSNVRALTAALVIILTVIGVGSFFFKRSENIMQYELRQKLQTMAAIGADQFDAQMIQSIKGPVSLGTPEMKKIVSQLRAIRSNAPSIRYAYIMRKTENPNIMMFVADADSLSLPSELDLNLNGLIDPDERASYPGDLYDASNSPELLGDAFIRPTVDSSITTDTWGQSVSGYAPIRDENGLPIAVLGLDMNANDYLYVTRSVFSPVAYLLVISGGILLGGYLMLYAWQRRLEASKELENERYTFMNLALHQLGAPLATFKWWMEILHEQNEGKFCDGNEICVQMDEGVNRMSDVLESLRRANRVWKGDIHLHPEIASIKDVVAEQVKSLETDINTRKQTVTITGADNAAPASFDKKLMGEVIHELLDNASSYSPHGGTIDVKVTQKKNDITVTVEDHGCGIPTADLPNVFQKFTRGSNATQMKPVGNGLGLFVAKGILDAAKGTIGVKSTEGKGSVFTMTFPLAA
jgi:signal transduction histidine kinase